MFKKLLGQPLSALLPKLKQIGAFALALHSPPTSKEAISTSAHARTASTKEASASKSKYSSYFLFPCIFCHKIISLLLFTPFCRSSQEIQMHQD